MILRRRIDFWSDDVGCFCHEAMARALAQHFGDCEFGSIDLAHEKFKSASDANRSLAESAWAEYLRNGPSRAFALSTGVTGVFSRYVIEFQIPADCAPETVASIHEFLQSLRLGEIQSDDAG